MRNFIGRFMFQFGYISEEQYTLLSIERAKTEAQFESVFATNAQLINECMQLRRDKEQLMLENASIKMDNYPIWKLREEVGELHCVIAKNAGLVEEAKAVKVELQAMKDARLQAMKDARLQAHLKEAELSAKRRSLTIKTT